MGLVLRCSIEAHHIVRTYGARETIEDDDNEDDGVPEPTDNIKEAKTLTPDEILQFAARLDKDYGIKYGTLAFDIRTAGEELKLTAQKQAQQKSIRDFFSVA